MLLVLCVDPEDANKAERSMSGMQTPCANAACIAS